MLPSPKNNTFTTYPFGSIMASVSKGEYRYGFNGMEKDDELNGEGNSLDFGARIYDSRLGRWMSVDPLAHTYPSLTPYHGIGNNPILFKDIDGRRLLLPYRSDDGAEWSKFKAISESRFDGLVTITRERMETGRTRTDLINGKPVIIKEEYWEVKMNYNEDAIHGEALKRLKEKELDATTDLIANEKGKIKEDLEKDYAYSTLNKMTNKTDEIHAKFNLFDKGYDIGLFAGDNSGVQQINVGILSQILSKSKGLSFNILFHEISEGFEYAAQKKIGGNLSYAHSHLKAIENQVEDLNSKNSNGVVWINHKITSALDNNLPIQSNYNIEVTVYSKNSDGNYLKSTITANILNGNISGKMEKTNNPISSREYNNEKKSQISNAKSN